MQISKNKLGFQDRQKQLTFFVNHVVSNLDKTHLDKLEKIQSKPNRRS